MRSPLVQLLTARRFAPLFVTQFLGALNDNLLKSALGILVTFRLAEQSGMNAATLAVSEALTMTSPPAESVELPSTDARDCEM